MPEEIRYTLDLALRLIDTATGVPVAGRDVVLLRDGAAVRPMVKGSGNLVLLGLGRADFDLTVEAPGYERRTERVHYAGLDPGLPLLELHLIPGRGSPSPYPCLTLEGERPGLTGLCAVRAGDSALLIRDFEPRKRVLTLFNPHGLDLDRVHYALVDPDQDRFEPFRVRRRLSDQQFVIDRVLETVFGNYFPVCPLVFGAAGPGGRYHLRVRDDATAAQWLVRWDQGEGPPQYKRVDFRRPETLTLN